MDPLLPEEIEKGEGQPSASGGLGGLGRPEEVVPVLGAARAEAPQGGAVALEGGGGVAGGVGVEAAEGEEVGLGVEPRRPRGGDAGGGGENGSGRQAGRGSLEGGERVEGAFDEQDGGGRAAGLAGAGSEGLEGALAGAGWVPKSSAPVKDGVAAGVGVKQAAVAAAGEQAEVEAAGGVQEGADGRPAGFDWRGQVRPGGPQLGGGRGRERAEPRFEEFDGGDEMGAGRMHDEIDRPAAGGGDRGGSRGAQPAGPGPGRAPGRRAAASMPERSLAHLPAGGAARTPRVRRGLGRPRAGGPRCAGSGRYAQPWPAAAATRSVRPAAGTGGVQGRSRSGSVGAGPRAPAAAPGGPRWPGG